MKGSASVRVTVVVLALALIAAGTAASSAGSVPAAIAKGASGPSLVQFVRPATHAAQAEAEGDVPPVGVRLYTGSADGNRFVELDGQPAPGTGCCDSVNDPKIYYALIDRRSLQITSSGSVGADLAGFRNLGTVIKAYTGGLNYLLVLNWNGFGPQIDAERNAFSAVLQTIGTAPLSAAQRQALVRPRDSGDEPKFGSAIGVVGAPAGSSYVTSAHTRLDGGGMWGYLRRNGVTGKYDFVFTQAVAFDTQANQTPTDSSPAKLTIKIGAESYTEPNPGGGVSGFHLLTLDANTLARLHQAVYATDTASGAEQPDEVQRLASDLNHAADDPNRPLVILQAFGAPHGADRPWGEAAKAIARLGGTLQVFNAMNAVDPRALNDEKRDRKGPYAFVGRVDSSAPLAEQSYSMDGLPGRLLGVLMRGHDGGFAPMFAGPPLNDGQSPVNTELMQIANQPPQPFPAFKDTAGRPIGAASAEAVQKFLGGPEVAKLCSATATVCNIRESYYENYGTDWSSIQDDLTNAKEKCATARAGFTVEECEGIRVELRDEVSMVAKVRAYFGPNGLQEPFGTASVEALADLSQISQEIQDKVQAPATDNTTANVLDGISNLFRPAQGLPPPASNVATALAGAFGAAAYFTRDNGSPNLIGAEVRTEASKLGVELEDHYTQADDNLDDLGRLIVSDYGKLTAVASKVDAKPGPGERDWRLGNVGQAREALRVAAKQTIYERLVPLAYPKMYELGLLGNAREWYCDNGILSFLVPDKYLFKDQADSAQFVGRFPETSWSPLFAVGRAHATGHGADARIPGIPPEVANTLFKPVADGGVGLSKLEFYSTRNGFRYFPSNPALGTAVEFDTPDYEPNLLVDQDGFRIDCSNVPDPPGNSGND
jgi:hypothetical protein